LSQTKLPNQQVNSLCFLNAQTLVKVNTELLTVLQDGLGTLANSKNDKNTLKNVSGVYAEAFVRVMPFFKMYAAYCHQYPVAIDRLLICRAKNGALDVSLDLQLVIFQMYPSIQRGHPS
jgi:hypothetical protein